MSTLVYVINQNGHSLMPCQPSKARKLLRDRRAKVIDHSPFTIKLLWDCEEQVQEVTLGIGSGTDPPASLKGEQANAADDCPPPSQRMWRKSFLWLNTSPSLSHPLF